MQIDGDTATLTRLDIHDVTSGIHLGAAHVTITDSYIWNMVDVSGLDHNDAIISNGGCSDLVIRHNNLQVPLGETTPLALYVDDHAGGPNDDVQVEDNLFNGGGYCTYAGGGTRPSTAVRYTGNHFGRMFFARCGQYGAVNAWSATGGNVWTGNVWDDTGAPVSP